MEASNEGARGGSRPRKIFDVRDSLTKEVSDRLDNLVARYEGRIAQQRTALGNLMAENARLRDLERSLRVKVGELQYQLDEYLRDAKGRGSW